MFRALTDPDEILRWFPHTYGENRVKRVVFEQRVGGRPCIPCGCWSTCARAKSSERHSSIAGSSSAASNAASAADATLR